jgi:hypothetical protein
MDEQIYQYLQDIAKRRDCTSYAEVARMARLDLSQNMDRAKFGEILSEISIHEHRQGRPLLSAVVLYGQGDEMHPAFFRLARELGVNRSGDDLEFFIDELRRVHEYWSKTHLSEQRQ